MGFFSNKTPQQKAQEAQRARTRAVQNRRTENAMKAAEKADAAKKKKK